MKRLRLCLFGLFVIVVGAVALAPKAEASVIAVAVMECVPQNETQCGSEAGCRFCSGTLCPGPTGGTIQTCTYACGTQVECPP